MKPIIAISSMLFVWLIAACDKLPQSLSREGPAKAALSTPIPVARSVVVNDDFEWARNIEQVPFCVPIPKGEYVREEPSDQPRANQVYVHKTRKNDLIQIRGLLRSDTKVSVRDYFHNTYAKAEESGQVIEDKKLIEAQGVFYARGYMTNKIHEQRYLEVTWVRKDDVVVYTALFALSEVAAWQKRLDVLLRHNAQCE